MTVHPARTPLFGLPLYFADGDLAVLEKPAGMLMHRSHPVPQASLLEMVRREWWRHPSDGVAMPHRLDRDTSGICVAGLTGRGARAMSMRFENRQIDKEYMAIVWGEMADDAGTIDRPVGAAAKPARTRFTVLGRRGGYSLVRVAPDTGRNHQIRIHLAAVGHPIVGDKEYGSLGPVRQRCWDEGWGGELAQRLMLPRHALHASRVSFEHPFSGARLTFSSALPADLAGFWEAR